MNPNKDKSVCEYNEFRRPRYFHGMLLDDKDFLDEQGYHVGKRRLLNRMLHGTGVVCGLDLNAEKGGRWIEITSGLALDCCGREIYVSKTQRFDLSQLIRCKKSAAKQGECEEPDTTDGNVSYYVGIRYDEKETNPVSVYLPGAGCEERTCEHSRIKEGYCVELLDRCPKPHAAAYQESLLRGFCACAQQSETVASPVEPMGGVEKCLTERLEEFAGQSVPCPECDHCEGGCVVGLGLVEVDRFGAIVRVSVNECREYVLTAGLVRHLIVGALSGAENYLTASVGSSSITIPPVAELVRNPISALQWVLRNFLIAPGKMVFNKPVQGQTGKEYCNKLAELIKKRIDDPFNRRGGGKSGLTTVETPRTEALFARSAAADGDGGYEELRRRTEALESIVDELQKQQPLSSPPA